MLKKPKGKTLAVYILILAIWSAVCLELLGFIVIVVMGKNFYYPLNLKDTTLPEMKEKASKVFSTTLGWGPKYPKTALGYRGIKEKNLNNAILSLFGCSYTQGNPDLYQSWAEQLEKKLGQPVLNFGVSGYGTDQALLRFQECYIGKIDTPYVLLGITPSNIGRNVNLYKGFRERRFGMSLTKPMFYIGPADKIKLLPNPLSSAEELHRLQDPAFLDSIGKTDYWYRYYGQYGLNRFVHFPYGYYFARALPFYVQHFYERRVLKHESYRSLYEDATAKRILIYTIDQFIDLAKKNGAIPIILFMPSLKECLDYQRSGSTCYNSFVQLVSKKHNHVLDAMNYFKGLFENGKNPAGFFRPDNHYNPRGEAVVAEGLYRTLKQIQTYNENIQESKHANKLNEKRIKKWMK